MPPKNSTKTSIAKMNPLGRGLYAIHRPGSDGPVAHAARILSISVSCDAVDLSPCPRLSPSLDQAIRRFFECSGEPVARTPIAFVFSAATFVPLTVVSFTSPALSQTSAPTSFVFSPATFAPRFPVCRSWSAACRTRDQSLKQSPVSTSAIAWSPQESRPIKSGLEDATATTMKRNKTQRGLLKRMKL